MTKNIVRNISIVGDKCTGCGVCSHICRKGCIKMQPDKEGFLYPFVNDDCNGCGLCQHKCPQLKDKTEQDFNKVGYIGITKDKTIYKTAASGGIFGTMAKIFLTQKNAFVCGASYIDGLVKHVIISDPKDVILLQNSKYVQSNLEDVFPRIMEIMAKNGKVLFCGTPCQVDGLYSFLGKRPDTLFTIDLVCHGVPSPAFLEKDLKKYKPTEGFKNVTFRWKNSFYQRTKSAFFLSLHTNDGKKKIISSSFDTYFACFMRNESFRLSCYSCKYANLNRCGDITIGDCDSSSFYPHFYSDYSRSTIILNNEQGQRLWRKYEFLFDFLPLDLERESSCNHQLSYPSKKPKCRSEIYKDVATMSNAQLQRKYCKAYTWKHKLLFLLQRKLPSNIVNKMVKILHV